MVHMKREDAWCEHSDFTRRAKKEEGEAPATGLGVGLWLPGNSALEEREHKAITLIFS